MTNSKDERRHSATTLASLILVPKLRFGNVLSRNFVSRPPVRSVESLRAVAKQSFGKLCSQTGVWEQGLAVR